MVMKVPTLKGIPMRKIVLPEPEEKLLDPPKSLLILPGNQINGDERVQGISKRLSVGYSETIGKRKTMEDKLVIYGSYRARNNEDYIAVFDGHNGDSAAAFCAKNLHIILAEMLDTNADTVICFKETFLRSNKKLKTAITQGGTTAVVALFKGNELYVANAGDSRAVISRNSIAKRVTIDHKPTIPEEKERIERAGGYVDHKGTVTGSLAVSRSLGDFGYHPFVTCDPDVFGPYLVFEQDKSYQLLILACDGLWDVVTDQEAVDIALASKNPEDAAKKLRETASEKDSKDNISVVVIFFPHFKPQPSEFQPNMQSQSLHALATMNSNSEISMPSSESFIEIRLKIPSKMLDGASGQWKLQQRNKIAKISSVNEKVKKRQVKKGETTNNTKRKSEKKKAFKSSQPVSSPSKSVSTSKSGQSSQSTYHQARQKFLDKEKEAINTEITNKEIKGKRKSLPVPSKHSKITKKEDSDKSSG